MGFDLVQVVLMGLFGHHYQQRNFSGIEIGFLAANCSKSGPNWDIDVLGLGHLVANCSWVHSRCLNSLVCLRDTL